METTLLYVCDGSADGCKKTFCKFDGNGDCYLTTQEHHARYNPPREWDARYNESGILFEVEREPLG